jgi:hypothetical protein
MRLQGHYAPLTFERLLLAFSTARKHAACGAHPDDLCTIFTLAADFVAQFVLAIDNAF